MKKVIFSKFVLFLVVLTGMAGCKKGHQSMTQGVIVGLNYGSCMTCGGFYLNMSNDTVKGPATYYVLNWSDAAQPFISGYYSQYNKNHLPVYVSFDWQPMSQSVPNEPANWIRITAIESR